MTPAKKSKNDIAWEKLFEQHRILECIQEHNCEAISRDDLDCLWQTIAVKSEGDRVPFPQANRFERVIDLLSLLVDKELTKEEITGNYQVDDRQTSYYTDAARYLGLVQKQSGRSKREIIYSLTQEGHSIVKNKHKYKVLGLIKKILEDRVFYKVFDKLLEKGKIPEKDEIIQIMNSCDLKIKGNTIERRSTTVRAWIDWILAQFD